MDRVLIIGNNGYVGSLLTNHIENTFDVVGVDLCLFGPNLGKSHIRNMSELTNSFLSDFDAIVCLAGHSSVQLSVLDPKGAIDNNIVNLNRLMYLLRPNQKLIYASSASVYGSNILDAMEHQENYQMHNVYDMTKQTGDDLAKHYIDQNKNIVGLRFGTICGISPNTRTDLAINNMILTASRENKFWVSNIHTNRSFLAVNDAACAIKTILKAKHFTSGVYNIKSFDCNMLSVANVIKDITGYQYEIVDTYKTSYDYTINMSKIYNDYEWKSKYDLQSLVTEVYENIFKIKECRRDCFRNSGVLDE